jgi:voltage-gated potassium channel
MISVLVLLAVYCIGVTGYIVLEPGIPMLDAMYMVLITLSTVGFRETVPMDTAGEIWTMVIILFGIAAVAASFGSLTAMVVEGEVGRLIGSRKLESRISKLDGHAIVCGFGRMGRQVVELLVERKVPIVVVEKELTQSREIEQLNQLYVVGDATEEHILRRAGIARAKYLVAVLAGDADNVFVTLTGREMRPDLYIVARAEQPSSQPKLRRAGANRVISPQSIGAERIANLLTRPHLVDFVDVAAKGVELEMDEFLVSSSSPMAGRSLREIDIRRTANVMVIAIKSGSGETRFNPGADEVLHPDDTLIMIGQAGAAARLAEIQKLEQAPEE